MYELTGGLLAVTAESSIAVVAAAISCGIIIIGASFGIATIGGKTVEAAARQPEISGRIVTAMVIAASLIEGVTFFALVICLLTVLWMR